MAKYYKISWSGAYGGKTIEGSVIKPSGTLFTFEYMHNWGYDVDTGSNLISAYAAQANGVGKTDVPYFASGLSQGTRTIDFIAEKINSWFWVVVPISVSNRIYVAGAGAGSFVGCGSVTACTDESYIHEIKSNNTTYGTASNSGTVVFVDGSFYSGSDVTATAVANTGYIFTGWSGDTSYATIDGDKCTISKSVKANVTITANFSKASNITLSFNTNGGSGSIASQTQTVAQGTSATFILPSAPTAPLYKAFGGWLVDGTVYSAGSKCSISSSTTAVAQWVVNISISNNNPSVGTLSLFDVSTNRKVADEVNGVLEYYGQNNHVYRVDTTIVNDLYENRGMYVNGNYVDPFQFTLSSDGIVGTYYFIAKPLYSFVVDSVHGSVVVTPGEDSSGGLYARGRTINIAITPDAGYEARQATFVNIDTNDVVNKSIVDNAVSLDSITFNTIAVIDYVQIDYGLSAAKHTASASAISSVFVTVGGNAAETAHYGDTAVFTATVASDFLFAGWYDGSGNLVSEDAEYSAKVLGAISLYAKAKVAAALSIAYDDEGAESCTITVDGEAYTWGDTFYVILGESFSYALTLGDRVIGTPWQFDCWKSGDTALAYGQSGEVTPSAAFSMTAHVAAIVSRAIDVVAVRMGDSSAEAADADGLPGAITCYGEATTATDESGGSGAADPFRFVFSQTQIVHVIASANVTFTGDSDAKSFYCFSTTDPSTLVGTATPPEESVI